MWDSAEHDMRGWHRHAWEGIGLMDYGQRRQAEGHCQAGREGERRGHCWSQPLLLLPYQLVCGRQMFLREGEERKEATKHEKRWLAGMLDYKVASRKQIAPVAWRLYYPIGC